MMYILFFIIGAIHYYSCKYLSLIMMLLIGINSYTFAQDTLNIEELGIVNGSVNASNRQVEIIHHLSGRPLYLNDNHKDSVSIASLLIEQAKVISEGSSDNGQIIWVQLPINLFGTAQGNLQLPLQVRIKGDPVKVTVKENSIGVILELPEEGGQVLVSLIGAARFIIPANYRGDLKADIRITGNSVL